MRAELGGGLQEEGARTLPPRDQILWLLAHPVYSEPVLVVGVLPASLGAEGDV